MGHAKRVGAAPFNGHSACLVGVSMRWATSLPADGHEFAASGQQLSGSSSTPRTRLVTHAARNTQAGSAGDEVTDGNPSPLTTHGADGRAAKSVEGQCCADGARRELTLAGVRVEPGVASAPQSTGYLRSSLAHRSICSLLASKADAQSCRSSAPCVPPHPSRTCAQSARLRQPGDALG